VQPRTPTSSQTLSSRIRTNCNLAPEVSLILRTLRPDEAAARAATASGLCSISPRSRRPESAGCNDQACFLSPQSMATKAAKRGSSLPSLFIMDLLTRAGALLPRKAYSRVLVVPDGI
jgi:hypothetical protein